MVYYIVDVEITGLDTESGIQKIEYQKVASPSDYDENGTWILGDSFCVTPDDKFIVYAKITDNAGNFAIINSDRIIVDNTIPNLSLSDNDTE